MIPTVSCCLSALVLIMCAFFTPVAATQYDQSSSDDDFIEIKHRRLVGPRLGVSFVIPQEGKYNQALKDREIGNYISQFGWQFEWMVRPEHGGPAFVTELIPFFGGVEYSTIIPSVSLVFGIRMPFGLEFGMGPHITATFSRNEPVSPSLVVAIGQSLQFSGVNIPLNLALSTSKSGNSVAFIFGYALAQRN